MQNKRYIISTELLQTAVSNLILLCLEGAGHIGKTVAYFNGDLYRWLEKAIRQGANTKEYMLKLVDTWIDTAVEETIYKNEERWQEFGFDLDDIEQIVEEDNIEEKAREKVKLFITNI